MEIFKIERVGGNKAVSVTTPSENKRVVEEEVSHVSEDAELAQAKLLSGEAETIKPTTTGGAADGANPAEGGDKNFTLDASEGRQVMVKIDGPLGNLFTQALNKVLAFENMIMVPVLVEEYERKRDDISYNDTIMINVQAYDANEMTTADVVDISNEITKTTQDDHILVMESARGVGAATGIAEQVCRSTQTASCLKLTTAASRVAFLAAKAGV